MKQLLFIAIVILCLAVIATAGPKIQIPETHWDLGKVPQGSSATHSYWIKNTGDETLKIIQVRPG